MEPMTRFELVTSSLPRKRSTPELHRLERYFCCECVYAQGEKRLTALSEKVKASQHKKLILLCGERETGFEPATFSLEG